MMLWAPADSWRSFPFSFMFSRRKFADSVPFPTTFLPKYGDTSAATKSLDDKESLDDKQSLYGDGGLREKDFDPDVLLETPPGSSPPRNRNVGLWSKFFGWPALLILGQSGLQILAWGFFIGVKARGQSPLPSRMAQWVKDNGHLVTLFTTLIATVLAGFSSFLFSHAIRRSMSLYLYRPMSLATLGASVSIATRSVVFHRRGWKWPIISFVFFILTGVQTSGWTTLLTPVTITFSTPLVGSELDLSSADLRQMQDRGDLDYCIYSDTSNSSLYAIQTESGYAAARGSVGETSAFALMGEVWNVSTGGILPAYLVSVDASAWFTNNSFIPVTTHNVSRPPTTSFSSNYSMIQQGFTANVSCQFRNLTNDTTPAITRSTTRIEDWYLRYSEVTSPCPMPAELNYTYAYAEPDQNNYAMLIVCPGVDAGYSVILVGHGKYHWLSTVVCAVSPEIMTMNVDYTTAVVNATIQPNSRVIPDPDGPTGLSAVATHLNMVWLSQGIGNNILGDHLNAIMYQGKRTREQMLKPLEAYLRGVAEYTGSVFRGCVSSNTTFPDGVPLNMSIPTNGTFHTETLGWAYPAGTARWVLIPGTLIALATIAVVVVAVYRHTGEIPPESNRFDPSNPLHLMAAAAAGGLSNTFRGLNRKDIHEGAKLDVVLGSIPGRGTALVRADEYSPVFEDPFSPRSDFGDGVPESTRYSK
ncbi:hypothetical protein C8R46DRAFT_295268 [Mycena filopes]|nr:hypothetical protein C8R46DRAFT_295268 [Mycena filopes]